MTSSTASSTTSSTTSTRGTTDATWLRLVQVSIAVCIVGLVSLAVAGTFFTTITGGDFRYTADYWYTGAGLPITLGGIGLALGFHKLQHGADGRVGTIGVWVNTIALIELFAQLSASLLTSAEVRWGPAYVLSTLVSFVGMALLAAGSWRTGLLPRWMLGVWPFVWIVGSLAAQGPTPVLLVGFLVLLGITLDRRLGARAV